MNKIYVVGLGPGKKEYRTHEATHALKEADILCGYHVYIELVKEEFPHKPFFTTPMTQEVERCEMAIKEAGNGKTVAMLCSGDAGVYGMAGLLYELAKDTDTEIRVVAGVTAALGGAAVLGAPLMNDFVVISLSNLLTPWETIEKRLVAAALGDFVVCLYNPSSKRRADHLEKACAILMEHKDPETICGIVRNIGREEESSKILSLGELKNTAVDMFTTVFIGNKDTVKIGDKMVTRRGYHV